MTSFSPEDAAQFCMEAMLESLRRSGQSNVHAVRRIVDFCMWTGSGKAELRQILEDVLDRYDDEGNPRRPANMVNYSRSA
ncbi:MAG: hypothetical protein Aurels2KO_56020 [Aureliella sp.]